MKKEKGSWKSRFVIACIAVAISLLAIISAYLIVYELSFQMTVKGLLCVVIIAVYAIIIMTLLSD